MFAMITRRLRADSKNLGLCERLRPVRQTNELYRHSPTAATEEWNVAYCKKTMRVFSIDFLTCLTVSALTPDPVSSKSFKEESFFSCDRLASVTLVR